MSRNCKPTYPSITRDANNNNLYHTAGSIQAHGGRTFPPSAVQANGTYQQVTAKVLFGTVSAMKDLKLQENDNEREMRRTH